MDHKGIDGSDPAEKESQIRRLRELVELSSRQNPHLTTRLEKAAFLVLLRPVEHVGEDHYRIESEDGLRCYEVINDHCQCSGYLRHGAGHPCKHRLAISLIQRLGLPGPFEGDATAVDPELGPYRSEGTK
jgi:hypothetical protein